MLVHTIPTIAILAASNLAAQMPGAPVLQNAWAAPGLVAAIDVGGGSGGGGNTWAAAAGWAPGGAKFQLSGGLGLQTGSGAGSSSRAVYGVRGAFPLMQLMSGSLGLAGFVGVGGGAGNSSDTLAAKTIIPAGIALGYRRAVGSGGRGLSLYADPTYDYFAGTGTSHGYFRVGVGLDAGITNRLGVTVGVDGGAKAALGTVGPRGTLYGVGISMKLGR